MTEAIDHAGPDRWRWTLRIPDQCRMEAVFLTRKGGIYGHVKPDVSRLLIPDATRRIPYPRPRRDGASEMPGIS